MDTEFQEAFDDESGGSGGDRRAESGRSLIQETRIEARAIRERWPIAEPYRAAIMRGQIAIAIDPANRPRDRSRAAAVCVSADKLNIEDLKQEAVAEQHNHLHLHAAAQAELADEQQRTADQLLASLVTERLRLGGNGKHVPDAGDQQPVDRR